MGALDEPAPDPPLTAPGPLAVLRSLLLDPRAHFALLTACATLILFARAGEGPLPNYDDAYYGEKAKQMLRTGDWLTPRFAGEVHFDNPPLFLWLMAASFAVMGVNDYAAVLWSALAGVACVALTHRLASRLGHGPFEAWAAGVVLLSTGYFLKYANHAMFDVFLAALFLVGLLGHRSAWDGGTRGWIVLGAATGLGVLTKSVFGLFPLVVVGLHLLWSGRVAGALRGGAWLAPLVALAVMAPWYGYQLANHREAFVHEHFGRLLLERGLLGTPSPPPRDPFANLRELLLTYWPWVPLAAVGLWNCLRESFAPRPRAREWGAQDSVRLLVTWLVVVLGITSIGREQKLWYVMSVFPALAMLSARTLGTLVRKPEARARVTLAGFALAALAGAVLALTPWGRARVRRPDLQLVARAANSLVPPSQPIAFLGGNYVSVAHQFIFYSDRHLDPGTGDADGVRQALDAGGWALVAQDRMAELGGPDSAGYVPVLGSGAWLLVHAAPAPPVRLQPGD